MMPRPHVMGHCSHCAIVGCLEAVGDNRRGEKNQCGTWINWMAINFSPLPFSTNMFLEREEIRNHIRMGLHTHNTWEFRESSRTSATFSENKFQQHRGVWLWGHLGKTLLFAFPEHQIQEAADESHGEADPGQDVGGAVGALPEADHVKAVLLLRVDGHCNHHAQCWKEEKDHWCQFSIKASKVGKRIRLALFSAALS